MRDKYLESLRTYKLLQLPQHGSIHIKNWYHFPSETAMTDGPVASSSAMSAIKATVEKQIAESPVVVYSKSI